MKLFLDSSAIIDFLKNKKSVVDSVANADELYTSCICSYEVLIGESYAEEKGVRSFYKETLAFFDSISTLPLTREDTVMASRTTAKLMLKGKKIGDFDVLIATQALGVGATILTGNAKHFDTIKEVTGVQVLKV